VDERRVFLQYFNQPFFVSRVFGFVRRYIARLAVLACVVACLVVNPNLSTSYHRFHGLRERIALLQVDAAELDRVRDYWERTQDGVSVGIAHVIKTFAFIRQMKSLKKMASSQLAHFTGSKSLDFFPDTPISIAWSPPVS
jgi:hypothetical protein